MVKAGQPARPKTVTGEGEVMAQYLVAGYLPDDFDPSQADEAMSRDIDALTDAMDCRCQDFRWWPLRQTAHSGFWVLEAADLDEALAWGRKAAVACRPPV